MNLSQIHKWMTLHHLLDEADQPQAILSQLKPQELYLHVIGTLKIKRQIESNPQTKTQEH